MFRSRKLETNIGLKPLYGQIIATIYLETFFIVNSLSNPMSLISETGSSCTPPLSDSGCTEMIASSRPVSKLKRHGFEVQLQ